MPIPREDDVVRAGLSAAIERARPHVRYADALYERVYKVEVNLLDTGQLILKPCSLHGALQLRLVGHDGRHLGVKAGTLDPAALNSVVDRALAALELEPPDGAYGLAPIPNPSRSRYGVKSEPDLRDVDPGPRAQALVRAVQALCDVDGSRGISVSAELWAFWQIEDKWIMDSEGIFKSQSMPVAFMQVTFRARRGEKVARVRARFGSPGGLESLLDAQDALVSHVARELEEQRNEAMELLSARALTRAESESLTHYILHKSALVFIHEGLGHPIEADIVRAGSSAIVQPDGQPTVQPLGSDIVRIVDGPGAVPRAVNWETGFGTEFIDDEGVEVGSTMLVDNGRIVGMMHNRETAHAFNVPPTGNGFSQLGDRRLVRMRNTVLDPKRGPYWHADLHALIRGVSRGVVLFGSLGGAVAREGMSSSTQYGLLVRNGMLTGDMIAPANFAARTADCLRTVDGYAGGVDSHGVGFCGKAGQTRRVSQGGPEFVRLTVSPAVRLTFEEGV